MRKGYERIADEHCGGCNHSHPTVHVGVALCGAVLVLTSMISQWLVHDDQPYASMICAIAGAAILSYPLLKTAISDIMSGRFLMNELVGLAILAAFVLGKYQEAGIVAFFMWTAILIEERTAIGAMRSVEDLVKMAPSTARRLGEDGAETEVAALALKIGDKIRVRPGENFPVDGTLVSGVSAVNQASITGESLPVDKSQGDEVFAGTENLTGAIVVEVTRLGEDTTLGKVRDLILAAEKTRTPIMRIIDQYVRYYTPTILMVSAIVWFFTADLMRVVLILVMACPCALVIATPSAAVAAIAAAARLGILVKDVVQIEAAAGINALVCDKTGTLTHGVLAVKKLAPAEGVELSELLSAAVTAEAASNHPAAIALRNLAKTANVSWTSPESSEEVPGRGVLAHTPNGVIRVGRGTWLEENRITLPRKEEEAEEQSGMSVVYVANGSRVLGWVGMRDTVREHAAEAIEQARENGVLLCSMVTGDNRTVAEQVSARLKMDDVVSECLPQDKVAYVEELKKRGATVAVIGDGVNDAPALAAGNIGIAMGAIGSDVALNSASIALMSTDLRRIPTLIGLSRKTRTTILQNLVLGVAVIVGGIAMFIFGDAQLRQLADTLGMRDSVLKVLIAAALHNIGSFIVLFNSARLFRFGEELLVSEEAEGSGIGALDVEAVR